jgi:transposase InsO family protein
VQYTDQLVCELIQAKRATWKNGSGRNLHHSLKPEFECHQIKMGRDKFFDFLAQYGLQRKRKSKRAYTTNSYHFYHRYPNLVKDVTCTGPNQLWVSDITYVYCQKEQQFMYLFLLTDAYSRKILGYTISPNLQASGALRALKIAIRDASGGIDGLIHHSDRGIQYGCEAYTRLLKRNKVRISMTQDSNPLDNAIAERVNLTIKSEFMAHYTESYESKKQALTELPKAIAFYNDQRPHRSLNYLSPTQAHTQQGELKKKW